MSLTAMIAAARDPDAEHPDSAAEARSQLISHLTYAIRVIEHTGELLAELRQSTGSDPVADPGLTDEADGADAAAHLQTSLRTARAAYAVLHCAFTAAGPPAGDRAR